MPFRIPKAQGVWRKAKYGELPIIVTLHIHEIYATEKYA